MLWWQRHVRRAMLDPRAARWACRRLKQFLATRGRIFSRMPLLVINGRHQRFTRLQRRREFGEIIWLRCLDDKGEEIKMQHLLSAVRLMMTLFFIKQCALWWHCFLVLVWLVTRLFLVNSVTCDKTVFSMQCDLWWHCFLVNSVTCDETVFH